MLTAALQAAAVVTVGVVAVAAAAAADPSSPDPSSPDPSSRRAAVVATNSSVFYGGLVLPGLGALPCIRGPALVATPRALLAFAECRNFTGDHCWPAGAPYAEQPGSTEICYRRSTTAGKTWEAPLTLPVAQLHGSADAFNYRVVYSRISGRVIVHYSASPEQPAATGNHTKPFGNPNFQITSSTDGATWSAPESLEALGLGSVCGRYLGTDGSGAEDTSGRLLMSAYYEASPVGRAACLYASENGGGSWQVLSYPHSSLQAGTEQGPWEFSVAPLGGNNSQTMYLNGRHLRQPAWSLGCHPDIHPHNLPEPRIAGFSSDGGRTFALSPTDQPSADTDCDGSHFAALSLGNRTVLLAGPAGPAPYPLLPPNDRNNSGRRRMTLFQSADGAQTWSSQLLDPGYAGYAALSLLPGQVRTQAPSFCCASTVFLTKTTPFLGICRATATPERRERHRSRSTLRARQHQPTRALRRLLLGGLPDTPAGREREDR
eukprot:SAG22_NODE_18_length_32591_cov_38.043549_21_plen_489_part_00